MTIGRYVFFFKQKTAYEMRISDWSSDVCSSDLLRQRPCARHGAFAQRHEIDFERDHRMAQVQRTLQARMQLADPANRDAVAEDVGRASRVAPDRLRGPVVETGAGQRSHAFEIALQVVEINRAAGLAPLRIGDIAEIGREHVWTPVTNAQLVCRL